MTRQQAGYFATIISLFILLISYAVLLWLYRTDNLMQMVTGAALTLAPLLLFARRAVRAERRAFAALALLAPVYLLFGGIIWLWDHPYLGAWLSFWSITLEVGTIVHNFKKRDKNKKRK